MADGRRALPPWHRTPETKTPPPGRGRIRIARAIRGL